MLWCKACALPSCQDHPAAGFVRTLVAKDGLHRVIRDRVLADAQVLYAA
jgi:hypothetical protein